MRERRITARRVAGSAVTCPLCREELACEAIPCEACQGCSTRYHVDCARELGGCSTQGCPRKGEAPLPAVADERERRRGQLVADHEERLARFRAGRAAQGAAQRQVDLGAGLQLAGLVALAASAVLALLDGGNFGNLASALFVTFLVLNGVGRLIHSD
jgi:hypothetical protein